VNIAKLPELPEPEQRITECVSTKVRGPPDYGAFIVGDAMLPETTDFFQKEAQECRRLAAGATRKMDREFWLRLAQRWESLQSEASKPESVRPFRPVRSRLEKRFAKRKAA
jgi:hypothetical protein